MPWRHVQNALAYGGHASLVRMNHCEPACSFGLRCHPVPPHQRTAEPDSPLDSRVPTSWSTLVFTVRDTINYEDRCSVRDWSYSDFRPRHLRHRLH